MKTNWIRTGLATLGLLMAPSVFAATDTATGTVSVNVAPEASITVSTNPTLTSTGTEFASYTGNTTYNYKYRTTTAGGAGAVTVTVTTEFAATSGILTGHLSHVASTTGVATANAVSTTAAVTATGLLTFATATNSIDAGDTGTIAWTLVNLPTHNTGAASTTVTLTITAT